MLLSQSIVEQACILANFVGITHEISCAFASVGIGFVLLLPIIAVAIAPLRLDNLHSSRAWVILYKNQSPNYFLCEFKEYGKEMCA